MSRIRDVASHAGVSTSTVSNVLNGRGNRMAKDTLARVQAAIAVLQYRPSTTARQLKTGHTPMFGLLVPSLANPMYGAIAREIETLAQERHGFRLMIGNTYRDKAKEARFFDDLVAYGVRGVVIISSLVDEQHFESASDRGMVVVSYDRRLTPGVASSIDHVSVDNFEAARLATAHLIALGHRRLAFVTAAGMTMSRREKIRGFKTAARRAGLAETARVIEGTPLSEYGDSVMSEVGRTEAAKIAHLKKSMRPTGIVAVNDMMALGLMAGCREAGLDVPFDVSVVGMDDVFLAALTNPPLTTVHLPVAEMAVTIVDRMMSRLSDRSVATSEFTFQPRLVVRGSTAGPWAKTA